MAEQDLKIVLGHVQTDSEIIVRLVEDARPAMVETYEGKTIRPEHLSFSIKVMEVEQASAKEERRAKAAIQVMVRTSMGTSFVNVKA